MLEKAMPRDRVAKLLSERCGREVQESWLRDLERRRLIPPKHRGRGRNAAPYSPGDVKLAELYLRLRDLLRGSPA